MLAPFVGAVEQLMRMAPSDAAALASSLFARNRRAYEAVVNEQMRSLGQPDTFRLTNRDELRRLKAEAVESARSIALTYNRELARKVDEVVAAEGARGLNRTTLVRRLLDWDSERRTWKDEQVLRTETARVAHDALRAWVEASGLTSEVRYRLLPADSTHDDANDAAAAAGRLVPDWELESFGLPAHPNERHTPQLALPTELGREPALWLGG